MSSTPDPGQLPADPRLAHPATYSRDAVVAALASFYEGLPHVDPADICRAPAGGWPEISEASVAARGLVKTAEVVELLQRLPYLSGDNSWVAPDAAAVDYRAVVGASRGNRPWLWDLSGPGRKADPPRFPPWVVQLTSGEYFFSFPFTTARNGSLKQVRYGQRGCVLHVGHHGRHRHQVCRHGPRLPGPSRALCTRRPARVAGRVVRRPDGAAAAARPRVAGQVPEPAISGHAGESGLAGRADASGHGRLHVYRG